MKYAVIDIGSNSVRLMISENGKTLYKLVEVVKLAEGMTEREGLTKQATERTVRTVVSFCDRAKIEKVDEVFAFATAAVRNAVNGTSLVSSVKSACGLEIEVVSGETEAMLGRLGALGNADGGVIDSGGASTEVVVVNGGSVIYSKSVNVGAVSVKNACGQDKFSSYQFISKKLEEYGAVPQTEFYCIGGTATSIAAISQELDPYDPKKTDGFKIERKELRKIVDKLFSMSVEERKNLKGLQAARADVIAGGAAILLSLMEKLSLDVITVSEKDNLEGYLAYRSNYERKN